MTEQSALPIVGLIALLLLMRGRRESEQARTSEDSPAIVWPIKKSARLGIGQSVLSNRDGKGTPHKGIDIYADKDTPVYAATSGKVIRVTDGRHSERESARKAGLWVDILGDDRRVYRYLHLGSTGLKPGERVNFSTSLIGVVAQAHTSGLGDRPHLHFEIRQSDFTNLRDDYGTPIDPLTLLSENA